MHYLTDLNFVVGQLSHVHNVMAQQVRTPLFDFVDIRDHVTNIWLVLETPFHDHESVLQVAAGQNATPRCIDIVQQVDTLLLVLASISEVLLDRNNRIHQ